MIMKTKHILKGILAAGLAGMMFISCEPSEDPVIEELNVSRVFAPTGLTARVRNMTTIELNWALREDADHYVVEFSEDSLQFNNIIRTVQVMPDELPLQEIFEGETLYSARVKGVSASGLPDSKWDAVTVLTGAEQIMLPGEDADIQATEATLR